MQRPSMNEDGCYQKPYGPELREVFALTSARRRRRASSRTGLVLLGLLCALGTAACGESEPDPPPPAELPEGAQAISLLGEPLYPAPADADVRAQQVRDREAAREAYEADPDDADAIIWLGRRTAYLGLYREAIDIYTEGIEKHPEDPRMYRHRGHRYISVRDFDRAIDDLQRAAELVEGTEDRVEPDGQPNERNIPTSTLHFNIYYHLGLAHYLKGDFERALPVYRRCLDVSRNPDTLVATSHWLYMTLRRLGRDEEAARVLEPITADLDVIENDSYHRLLLMYRGEIEPEALWDPEQDDPSGSALAYGVANWHLYHGREELAERMFRQIVDGQGWAGFGYIAAEAELARMSGEG